MDRRGCRGEEPEGALRVRAELRAGNEAEQDARRLGRGPRQMAAGPGVRGD